MNLPNRLTVARILLAPVFLILLMVDFPCHYLAAGLVSVPPRSPICSTVKSRGAGGLVTNLGKFLDPIADKMLTTAAFLGFLAVGKLDVFAVMLILSREFMVTSVRLMAAKGDVVMAASIWGKAKTVAQFTSILVMLVALEFSTWQTGILAGAALPEMVFTLPVLFAQILIWVSVALTLVSGFQYVWAGRRYFADGSRGRKIGVDFFRKWIIMETRPGFPGDKKHATGRK